MKTALLMMAHGSRIAEANDAARQVAEMVRQISGFDIVEVSFRELHEPNIQQGIDACVAQGAQRVLLMPYFLFVGAHVQEDLPEEMAQARQRYPQVEFAMGGHLGVHRKLAEVATPGKIAEFRRREEERKARDARMAIQAEEYTETLNKTVLTLAAKCGEGDRLFGSVTSADIADAIKDARGFTIDKRKVLLEEPIKELGTFMVDVEVAEGFVATVKTIVSPA